MRVHSRRSFIERLSVIGTLLTAGGQKVISPFELGALSENVLLRFAVASDSHYGQPDTPYEEMTKTLIRKLNLFHQSVPCDFCVINGDIIHDDPVFMPEVKEIFDDLEMLVFPTQGNHDHVTAEEWEAIWGLPVNHSFTKNGAEVILTTTSNQEGEYLSPDLDWMRQSLSQANGRPAFLFVHIPQKKWTKHAIETPAFFALLSEYNNVKAVFHGHEHDQDGVILHDGIPYIFDSHIGGSWGTDYKGFRVVELMKNGDVITYMMNPDEEISRDEF